MADEEQVQELDLSAFDNHVKPKQTGIDLSAFDTIQKKNQVGNVSVSGGVNTPQLPLKYTSDQNGSIPLFNETKVFKDIGKEIPPELQQRHDEILARQKELNNRSKTPSYLQRYDDVAAPILGFNRDLVQSVNPKKVAEIDHDVNGHWGNIVQNVFAKIEKTGTDIAAGTLSLINDAEQLQNPVKMQGTPMDELIAGLNGNKQRMQSVIDNNQLPNTFLGNTVSSLASIAPDIAGSMLAPEAKVAQGAGVLAKAGGLLFNKFTNYLIGKGAVVNYGEAKEQGQTPGQATIQALKGGAEGAKQGIELALLGGGSGLATKSIMAKAEQAGLTGAKAMATRQLVNLSTDLVAYGLVQPTANAAEEGRFPTMKEIADGAGIAAAFRIKGGAEELKSHSKLNKAIEETQNQRQGVAIANFVDADHEAIKQVYDQPETAQELNIKALEAAKKAKETTDLSKKQEYVAQAITLTKASNVKSVADMVLNNPQGLEDFKNSPDIPDQVKQQFLQKAQEVTDLLKPKEDSVLLPENVNRETVPTGNIAEPTKTEEPLTTTPSTVKSEDREIVTRVEEPGVDKASIDKPHGIYTTPIEYENPHSDLGGEKHFWEVNKDAKVLNFENTNDPDIIIRKGATGAGAGVHAAKKLLGDEVFGQLKKMTKDELIDYANNNYGESKADFGKYFDRQEVIEAIGAMEAKKQGYDVIKTKDKELPQFSETVLLTNNAAKEISNPNETTQDTNQASQQPEKLSDNIGTTEKVPFEKFKAEQLDHISNVKDSKFDWRIQMDISQPEREKGVQDIKDGKDTAAARKVNEAIQDMYDNGVVPMNRGRGTQVQSRDFGFDELGLMQEHVPGVEKQVADYLREQADLTPEDHQFATDNIYDIIHYYESEHNAEPTAITGQDKQPTPGSKEESSSQIISNDSGESGNKPPIESTSTNTDEGGGNTGIKNKVSNETRTRLYLPKVEVPKLGKDVEVLHEGKKLVDDGTIDPQQVVNRIISTDNHNMSRDEAKAMQYYMHQLGRAQDLVNAQLSQDLEPKEKLELIGQQQQLSDLQDAATEANIKAGKDWSDVGNIRQILVDKSFNPSRERAIIKEAYGGDVPKEVKEKLDATIKERDEAIKERTKLEEQLRETEAKLKIAEMKKGASKGERKDHKANRAALIDELKAAKEEHEKWLEDNGIQKQGISGFSLTPKMAKIIGKIAADYVHEGYEKLEEIVNRVYEEVKAILPGIDKKDIRDAIAIVDAEKLNEKGEKLEKKIADNDIASSKPKLKQKFERNNDWVKANQRVINAEYKIRKLKNEAFNSQKNMYQKALMWASKLIRASVLSGTNVLYKLSSAAVIGGAAKRIPEQAIGQVYANIFRGIAEKAPIEGFSSAKAEVKFYKDFFNPKKFIQNSWQILKSGGSNLTKKMDGRMNDDLAEISMPGKQTTTGKKAAKIGLQVANKILEIPTDLHMVIKDPLKRATYEASFKNGMVWAEKNGLDINDPLVINTIENASYKRANYEIFQEDNALSKKFNNWKSKLDKGGNVEATGKVLADFMVPVSTVPTNIVKRLITTSPVGLIRGGTKVINAYRKGIENLSNEEADAVMRQLKQGTLGTALALVGWFGASHFGGLYSKYDPNKKRQEGELTSDEMEINGQMIPKPVQHSLTLEIPQVWATARHIYDNYRENKGASVFESSLNAGLGSAGALLEQVPIVNRAALAVEATQDPYKGEKLKEEMGRTFHPQFLREHVQDDPKQKFIDRNTKDGGLFRNDLKIYNQQGQQRVANLQEFSEFKDKRKELLEKRMNKLYDGTDDENILKSGKKKAADMSPSELTSAITNIKTQVNKEAKTELFGKQRMSHQERVEDKKLSRIKKLNQ